MTATFLQSWLPELRAGQGLCLVLLCLLLLLPRIAAASEPLDLFDSEKAAYQHCRNDVVVWLDVPGRTYFFRGQKGYAGSQNGGYTCWGDARATRNRPTSEAKPAQPTAKVHRFLR